MNGSKTRCATCGVAIQHRTADGHFGLCRPCYRKAVAKPPDGFEVPHDLALRIASQGGDPAAYREMLWRDGADSVHRFLNRIDDAADEYRRWAPRLRAFAAECRRAVPAPAIESLAGPEREQYHLLRTKMSAFAKSEESLVVLTGQPHHMAVLSTSRVGLAAAQEVFRGSDAGVLEKSEHHRWFAEIYQAGDLAFWWYALAWWSVEEGIAGEEAVRIRRQHAISAGGSCWIVRSGVQWGRLAGGGDAELWRWDGRRAEFIEKLETFSL